MEKIKKELFLKIVIKIVCSILIISFANTSYALRIPVNTNQIKERLDHVFPLLRKGEVVGMLKLTPLDNYKPWVPWSILTHTGITHQQQYYKKLMGIYQDKERARKEIFCCYNTTSKKPTIWAARGFGLILKPGEILYYGGLRFGEQQIFPLRLDEKELEEAKLKIRQKNYIDTTPSNRAKEVDITDAEIVGVFLAADDLSSTELLDFSILMAMAIKYKLPIVIIRYELQQSEEDYRNLHPYFVKFFEDNVGKMRGYLKQFGINPEQIGFNIEALKSLLRPVLDMPAVKNKIVPSRKTSGSL
ncbi:MAG: hypothetical protein AABY55_02020 [Candidatus Omnitrophota bacterium]